MISSFVSNPKNPSLLSDLLRAIDEIKAMAEQENISLSEDFLAGIALPHRTVKVAFLFYDDKGRRHLIEGYHVQYKNGPLPRKGGIRMDAAVTEEEVAFLALNMLIKCALGAEEFAGGKSGICCDAKAFSRAERRRIMAHFIEAISEEIGRYKYIPAGDMNTNDLMDVVEETMTQIRGQSDWALVTGKPVTDAKGAFRGGLPTRQAATGDGVAWVALKMIAYFLPEKKKQKEPLRVAIDGFGNVGQFAALGLLSGDLSLQITHISDRSGTYTNPEGIDIKAAIAHKDQNKSLAGFQGAQVLDLPIVEVPVDVLVLASHDGVVNADNAHRVVAKILVEGSNGGITQEGEHLFLKHGGHVAADVFANVGGVHASWQEWRQNIEKKQMPAEVAKKELKEAMTTLFDRVYEKSQRHRISLRMAAYLLALEKLSRVYENNNKK